MKTFKLVFALLAIVVLGLAGAPAVEAASIRVTDLSGGDGSIQIDDQDFSLDENLAPGIVKHTGVSFGEFVLDFELGVTKPAAGSATAPFMQLSLLAASTSATGGSLLIEFSETNFGPSGAAVFTNATGFTQGSVVYNTYQDPSNSLFGGNALTTNTAGPGPFTPIAFPNGSTLTDTAFSYSLTQSWTITHGPGIVTTSVDPSLLVVEPFVAPVPDGGWPVGLLGFALMGVEGLRRKYTRL